MSTHRKSILVLVENKIILIAMIAMVVMVPSACAGASIIDHNCTDLSQIPDEWSDNGASGIDLDDRGTPGCAEQGVQVICSARNDGDCIDEQAHRATCTEAILDDRVVIKKKFFFEDPVVGKGIDGYDMIRVPDLEIHGNPGMPVLPFKTVKILIPHGEDVKDIDIVTGNKVVLKGFFNIECGQTPVPISSKAKAVKTMPDQIIYASMHLFPGNLYSQVSIQELRGYRILILNLYPVQYAPKIGEISYFEEMEVIVTTTTPVSILSTAKTTSRGLPQDKARVFDIIDNPVEVDTYSTGTKTTGVRSTSIVDPADLYDYVIITDSALESAFQPLVDWKNKKGVSTTIVTVDQITSDPSYNGVDTQEEIRNFIIDAYSNWAIEYVLLGGDGDCADVGYESGDNIIPARRFWAMDYDGDDGDLIPADMYYSNLDGTFDYDNDGIYGEPGDGEYGGEVDLLSEVFIGRAPVDSVEEVSNFVNKTIVYESLSGSEPYLKKVLMVGEKMDDITWGGDYKDEIKDYIAPPWTSSTLYDRDYPEKNWPKSEMITRINQGQHVLNHAGHSSTLYVMKLCNAPIYQSDAYCGTSGNTDVDDLTNDKYSLTYSQGCYPGAFDNWHYRYDYTKSDSIAEHFVTSEHGAFAMIANSRYGWYVPGSTEGPSQYFDREFFDALFNENIRNVGKALQDSKEDNAGLVASNPHARWCYYEINLLGDPETSIHDPLPEPHDISLTHMEAPTSVKLNEIAIINVTINNIGQNDENNIGIEFVVNGIIEDAQTITTLNSGSFQKLSFSWSSEVEGDYSIIIYAVPVAGEVVTSNNIVQTDISVVSAEILLVDDDDEGSNYETYYSDALYYYYGYSHAIWDVSSQGSPSASDLQSYKIVIWLTGDDYSTTLNSTDQENLQIFLDNGGRLFVSGQDIGYDIGNTSFYQNYLHANYIQDDTSIYNLTGVADDPITEFINISISGGDGANNQNFPSEISPSDAYAEPIFYYEGDGTGALRIDTGTYRVVYFAFGFEAINDQWDRAYLMYRIINWLDIEPPGIYVSDHGATYVPAGNPVTINANVYDQSDISSVYAEIESPDENVIATIQLFDDGMHYDGSADDGIFGNSWTTHPEEKDYYIDFIANDTWGNSGRYNNTDRFTTVPFSATSDILLVDDSTYTSYIHYYEDALNLNGYSYNLWDPDLRGEIDSTINSFKLCIWSAPYGGPSSTEQSVLREFLDNAGRLFISGQDIGYSIGDTPFYQNYLHANCIQDDVDLYALNGVYGDPITGGINISIAGGDGANNQWYPSEIDPFAPAESIFYYNASSLSKENLPLTGLPVTPKDLDKTLDYNTTGISSSGTGALRVDTGTYRIVYFAFGFEAINNASDRDTVMDRIIAWFTQNDNTANDNVVTIENATLQSGSTQDVPIRLLNSTGVGGSTVTLTFNQSIVTVTSAVAGDFDSIFTPDYSNVSDGVLRVTCTKSGQDLTGDLTIATIMLEAVGTSGSGELGLCAELTEADGGDVPSRTVNGTSTVVDTTPPASITGLDNLTTEQSHIEWAWNDPTDADFAKVIIYLNGAFETNVSMGAQNYNATGLDPDTEYTISTHTVDEHGNVNQTWMNDTARTKPAPQLHHINVTPTSWTLIITESMNFTATGFDQNNAEISGLVFTWDHSDAYIGNFTTINDTTVNFTAEHVGITYITAKNGGVTSEQVQVTVNDAANSMNATGIKVFATTSGDANVTGEFDNNLTGWINITAIGNATSSAEVNQSNPRYGLGSSDKVVSGVIINVSGGSNIRSELAAGNGTIRIWICYDETTLAALGIDASTLAIWKYDNTTGEWKKQPSTISKTCVYADVNHLCTFGLVGSKVIGSSNDGTSTYQSNGGGGGGGGGGASGEAYANIALRERVERQIMKNRFVTYRFVKPGTDITFVNFTSINNYGSVATVVETLHNTSTLVAAAPPGTVYKNINLWVGSAGFATEKNMENVAVSFRVNRSWIDENSVSISTIRLHGYNKSGKTWAPLPVEITGKDESYIHFKSKTTIFNQLAITCPAPVSNPRSAPMSTASLAGTGTHVPEEASPAPFNATSSQTGTGTEAPAASASSSSIPGPGVVAVVVAVGSAAWLAWKKRRI